MMVIPLPNATHHFDPIALSERLRTAHGVTPPLMRDVVGKACRHFPSLCLSETTARLTRLIDAEAWTDAALVLLELELPSWRVRRIARRKAHA